MKQEYLSVKQLSEETGASKATIRRAVIKLNLQKKLHKIGNRYMLTSIQAEQIKLFISNETESIDSNASIESDEIGSIVSNASIESDKIGSIVSNASIESDKIGSIVSNASIESDKTNQNLLSILDRQLSVKDNQIQMLQEQLIEKDNQIKLLQEQLIAKDNQIGQITAAMESMATALTAEQALHAGTIQKQLAEHSVMEEPNEPEQPKQKQSIFSRLFGKKGNSDGQ